MAAFIRQKFTFAIENFGTSTIVPNDHVGNLMFYLHCVRAVLEVDDITYSLQNYHEYYNLSKDEVDQVVQLCLKYNPDVVEGKCFFNNPLLCQNSYNSFLKLSSVNESLGVSSTMLVGSVECAVTEVMVHDGTFYERRYHPHIQHFQPWIEAMKNDSYRPVRSLGVKIPPKDPFPSDAFADNVAINVFISYLFPVWIIVWMIMSIFSDKDDEN